MATKAAHTAFNRSISKYLQLIGAEFERQGAYSSEWTLKTIAGDLNISVHEPDRSDVFSLFCRFNDPEKATELLIISEQKVHLNPHSGKWNFHSYDAGELLVEFKEQIAPLLIKTLTT